MATLNSFTPCTYRGGHQNEGGGKVDAEVIFWGRGVRTMKLVGSFTPYMPAGFALRQWQRKDPCVPSFFVQDVTHSLCASWLAATYTRNKRWAAKCVRPSAEIYHGRMWETQVLYVRNAVGCSVDLFSLRSVHRVVASSK